MHILLMREVCMLINQNHDTKIYQNYFSARLGTSFGTGKTDDYTRSGGSDLQCY